jgi:beta-galactosidase
MHAGLNRPDNVPDTAFTEIQSLVKDIVELQKFTSPPTLQSSNALARVALIVDYEAQWTFEVCATVESSIEFKFIIFSLSLSVQIQPQGAEFSYVQQAFAMYSAARSLTLDVHIVSVAQLETDKLALQSFCLVLIPSQPHVSGPLAAALAAFVGPIVFGPRTGSKTVSFGIPESLPPSMPLQSTLLPLKVTRVESLRPNVVDSVRIPLADDSGALSNAFQIGTWREWAELIDSEQNSKAADFAFPGVSYVTSSQAKLSKRRARILSVFDSDGRPAILGFDDPSNTAVTSYYLAFAPTVPLLSSLFAFILTEKSIPFIYLPSSLRISSLPADPTSNQSLFFAFYYDSTSYSLDMIADGSRIALNGSRVIGPHSVVVFDRISFAKSDPNSDWTSGYEFCLSQ